MGIALESMTGLAPHSVVGSLLETAELPEPPATCCSVAHLSEDQPMSVHPAPAPAPAPATSPTTIWLGPDVHKESVTITVLRGDAAAPDRVDRLPNDLPKLKR